MRLSILQRANEFLQVHLCTIYALVYCRMALECLPVKLNTASCRKLLLL
jgi:hypothetical protein